MKTLNVRPYRRDAYLGLVRLALGWGRDSGIW